MHRKHAVFVLGLAVAGCGGMMTGTDGMHDAVDEAQAEDQAHLVVARTITTMPSMFDEVDRHTSRMNDIMEDMRVHMNSVHECTGIDSMMTLRDGMRAELDAHMTAMHGLVNVADGRAEVESHVGTMHAMLGDMDSMLGHMHCGRW